MFFELDGITEWCEAHRWAMTKSAERSFASMIAAKGPISEAELLQADKLCRGKDISNSASYLARAIATSRGISPIRPLSQTGHERKPTKTVLTDKAEKQFQNAGPVATEWVAKFAAKHIGTEKFERLCADYKSGNLPGEDAPEECPENDAPAVRKICLQRMEAPKGKMEMVIASQGRMQTPAEAGNPKLLQDKVALAMVSTWCDNGMKPLTIMLSGAPGTGKTTAAMLPLYRDALRANPNTQLRAFYHAWDLAGHASAQHEIDKVVRNNVQRVNVLVIDNVLGANLMESRLISAWRGMLLNLLETRQDAGKATILTTNLHQLDMAEQYGPEIMSHFTGERGLWLQPSIVGLASKMRAGLAERLAQAKIHKGHGYMLR